MSETKSPLGGLTRRGFLKTTGAVTAVAAVAGTGAALAPMPPLVPPPARLLTPPLVPLARARVASWVDYRPLPARASPRPVAFPKQFGNYLTQWRWLGTSGAPHHLARARAPKDTKPPVFVRHCRRRHRNYMEMRSEKCSKEKTS